MKNFFLPLMSAVLLTGCAQEPDVDVKKRWSRAIANYSFVPLYPARGGVEIGDIRIHRIAKQSSTLDSRLFYSAKRNRIVPYEVAYVSAVLPGIETFRLTKLNGDKLLKPGFLRTLFGTELESQASLSLSLSGLKTAEIADVDVVGRFLKFLDERKDTVQFRNGLCASAITLGDVTLTDIGISMVTRVVTATEIEYFASRGVSTTSGGAAQPKDGATGTPTGSDGIEVINRTGLKLDKVKLEKPITIGVDALSIIPANLFVKNKAELAQICKGDARFNRIEPARLDELRRSLGMRVR
ncbi:MAG: hypothetical protein AAF340_07975 [Pseudomonadota bacterium]